MHAHKLLLQQQRRGRRGQHRQRVRAGGRSIKAWWLGLVQLSWQWLPGFGALS
jgi:hypothetical protein